MVKEETLLEGGQENGNNNSVYAQNTNEYVHLERLWMSQLLLLTEGVLP